MSYTALPTRTTADANSSADVNQLQSNISYIYDKTPVQQNNFIYGLELSNDTDTEHDIQINTGSCIDSTYEYKLELSSVITKQIDAAWSVGDDAGGLDTGSVAADTWYYIWLIRKDSDGSIDALFSLSATSPTMPAGYTYKRRIRGAVLTDGSSNIIQLAQKDDYFWFNDRIIDLDTNSAGTTRQLLTVSCPPGFIGIFHLNVVEGDSTYIWFDSVLKTDAAASEVNSDIRLPSTSAVNKPILTDASSQIAYRSTRDAITTFILASTGFIDPAQS